MDFLKIKKRSEKKLYELKEELINKVVSPKNAESFTCKNGSLTLKPFGKYTSYIEVIFKNLESYASFLNDIKKIKDDLEEPKFYEDNVINFYKFSSFINNPMSEEIILTIKDALNKDIKKKEIDIEDIKEKMSKE